MMQHNSVWSNLFNFQKNNGPAAKVLKFRVRRLIYDQVIELSSSPNAVGARYLSFCLNVLGLEFDDRNYFEDSAALHKAVLEWTKKHFASLHLTNPRVAELCLVDGIKFDDKNLKLVKTIPGNLLSPSSKYVYLAVNPPSATPS
jgi:hypothetical protein